MPTLTPTHRSKLPRRLWCAGALALPLMLPVAAQAQSADWPTRPVTFVNPFAAGSAVDVVARLVAQKMAANTGVAMNVDNRTGASGNIGTQFGARAAADGHTLLLGSPGTMAINPFLFAKLPYDALKDFDPVTQITRYGYVLVVPPSLPVNSAADFVALARRRPGEVSYGTSGAGGSNHLAGELFRLTAGIRLNAVPYKGSSPALTALLSGEITGMFDTLITSIPLVKSGRLKALGVTLEKRSPALPAVPTLAESGVPGYRFDAWQSIVVPAGTPRAIVTKIHADTVKTLALPDVREKLVDQGANELVGSSPEEFRRMIATEIERYRKLIAAANVEVQ